MRRVANDGDWLVIARHAGETMRRVEQLVKDSEACLCRTEQVLIESAEVNDSVLKFIRRKNG